MQWNTSCRTLAVPCEEARNLCMVSHSRARAKRRVLRMQRQQCELHLFHVRRKGTNIFSVQIIEIRPAQSRGVIYQLVSICEVLEKCAFSCPMVTRTGMISRGANGVTYSHIRMPLEEESAAGRVYGAFQGLHKIIRGLPRSRNESN